MVLRYPRTVARHIYLVAASLYLAFFMSSAMALDMAKMTGEVWGSGNRNLVVILHGDGGPGRYDNFAKSVAALKSGTTVVTLNRPGYGYKGKSSPGIGNNGPDLYTKRNNDYVASALAAMKKDLRPGRLIVIGHSGGSGQLGTIIGRYPGLVDVAFLVSCPCNVPKWRQSRRGTNNWTKSQSPHDHIKSVPARMPVLVIVGDRDSNTRPKFSEEYVEISKSAGKSAQLVMLRGGTHTWSTLEASVRKLVSKYLK
jgi:pimeloyl-ACP methyl ester carboxylesterase